MPKSAAATSIPLQVTAELVRAHELPLWRYLQVLGCPNDVAEDLVQEAFVALIEAQLEDRGAGATRTWLRTTVRNGFLAHCRRTRRSPLALDAEAVAAAWAEYERDDDGERYRVALRACLDALPRRQHDLLLAQVRDRTSAEVLAAQAGLALEGVRSALRRLKGALRDCVARRLHDDA